MSNRKYAAAVLEDGPASKEQRMEGIIKILSEKVNEAAQNIVREGWTPASEHEKSFQNVVKKWFEEMNPELAKEYDIIVGTVQDPVIMSWRIVVGYRPKPKMSWHDWAMGYPSIDYGDTTRITAGHIHAGHINTGTIDAIAIQAGSITADRINTDAIRDVQTLRMRERYGMGILNTGGVATARLAVDNIQADTRVWHTGNGGTGTGLDVDMVDGIHVRDWATAELEPFDLQVGDTTYHNVEITGVTEDV